MNTSRTLFLTWPIAVLAVGLISCSSDNKNTEEVIVSDPWPAPEVTVLKKGGDRSGDLKPLEHVSESTDIVEFSFKEATQKDSIKKIDVESQCSPLGASEPVFVNKYSLKDASSFRFLDTLPDDLLIRADEKLNCTFKVKITNPIGSTKSYELLRLTLDRTKEEKVMFLFGPDRKGVSDPIKKDEFEVTYLDGPSAEGDLEIFCTYFKAKYSTRLINEVTLGNFLKQVRKLPEGMVDPRRLHPIQSCRILMRDTSPARMVTLSKSFNVDFGAHQIQVSSQIVSSAQGISASRIPVQRLSVNNPNPFPVAVVWPRSVGSATVLPKYRATLDHSYGGDGTASSAPLNIVADTAVEALGSQDVVNIPANSSVAFTVFANIAVPACARMKHDATGIVATSISIELAGAQISINQPVLYFDVGVEPHSKEKPFRQHTRIESANSIRSEFYQSWDARPPSTKALNKLDYGCY